MSAKLVEVIQVNYVDDDEDAVAEFWTCDGTFIGLIVNGKEPELTGRVSTGEEN